MMVCRNARVCIKTKYESCAKNALLLTIRPPCCPLAGVQTRPSLFLYVHHVLHNADALIFVSSLSTKVSRETSYLSRDEHHHTPYTNRSISSLCLWTLAKKSKILDFAGQSAPNLIEDNPQQTSNITMSTSPMTTTSSKPRKLYQLTTPAFIVNRHTFRENCDFARSFSFGCGITRLRP